MTGRLWFADQTAGEILALSDGAAGVKGRAPAQPHFLDFQPSGAIIVVSARRGRLLRQSQAGETESRNRQTGFSRCPNPRDPRASPM